MHDTTSPTIEAAAAPTTVEGCPATYTPGFTDPTSSDNCSGTTLHPSDSSTGDACSTTFTRTWYASDACNNTSGTVSQSITVHDATSPTIGAAAAPTTVEGCPATYTPSFTTPTASDNCSADRKSVV